jgi:hypothetical protein
MITPLPITVSSSAPRSMVVQAPISTRSPIEIGENCLIQSSTVIGADGFGYANDRGNWVKIPQLGRVIIGVITPPATAVLSPITTLCAIWHWLSMITPLPITV